MSQTQQPLPPEEFTAQVRAALPLSTSDEKHRLIELATAWATLYYEGKVPPSLLQDIRLLEGYRNGTIR
jgi:hypothetical protein